MKHIESILPEQAASEISRMLVGDDDATATAALTTLLHNVTGCDIPQTSDLPESEVEELVPLCVSILRRHWQTPLTCLGDGSTPMSLADLLRQLIDGRVNGNEALGIPPANANLPTALAALTKRHIDDGLTLTLTDGTTTSLPDGLSLAQLLCSGLADNVTEIVDSNTGWTMTKALTNLPNLEKLQLNCVEMNNSRIVAPTTITHLSMPFLKRAIYDTNIVSYQNQGFVQDLSCESVEFPSLEIIKVNGYGTFLSRFNLLKKAYFPNLTEFNMPWQGGIVCECDLVEEIYLPKLSTITTLNDSRDKLIIACPNLKKVVFGKNPIPNFACRCFVGCTSLIHLEFSEVDTSLYLGAWTPTSVLSDSERLPEFLSNFKQYIAERLTDKGSGLTLTLSQAVRDAIQTDPEIVSIITSKGWTISPAPSV